jgi:LysM repeat protein
VSIAIAQSQSFTQIESWNPILNSDCSNIVVGQLLCISPPGGTYTPTTIAGVSATQIGPYATATAAPPGATPFGTTANCGAWYQVVSGDNCQQISLNQTITVSLFEEINPSINEGCTNLSPGLWYCIQPTEAWNATDTSDCITATTVSAPAPTTTGVIGACYEWYTVQSGDYCALIEQEYNITFAQLTTWNPALDSSCSNLILGDA